MKITLSFVLLAALSMTPSPVSANKDDDDRRSCSLMDPEIYTRVAFNKKKVICYFIVANATMIVSKLENAKRLPAASELCAAHQRGSHLPRIRSEEEAVFILQNIFDYHFAKNLKVDKILLGIPPLTPKDYRWDDQTKLTYKPLEWNMASRGPANWFQYVYMHAYMFKYGFNVIWTSGGEGPTNIAEPVGVLCQLEMQNNAADTDEPALAETGTSRLPKGERNGAKMIVVRSMCSLAGFVLLKHLVQ